MTDRDPAPAKIPDLAELQQALSAVRHDQPLEGSPLIEMDAVWEVALREGVAPDKRGKAWALGQLIVELVQEQLDLARRSSGITAVDDALDGTQLDADFAANSSSLEIWSALYHRFLDPAQLPAGEIGARVGMPRRTLSRRVGTAQRKLAKLLADRNRRAARRLADRPDLPIVDSRPAIGDEATQSPEGAMLQAVRGTGQRRVPIAPEALERLAAERPTDLESYRLSRVAAWSRPAYRVDARFVELTLLLDRGEEEADRWQAESGSYEDLSSVLGAVDSQAVVLLGPPGSGKSTLLRRFELDLASAGLRGETEALPFFVSLGRYWADSEGNESLAPAAWLAGLWGRRYPDLPPFIELLDAGRLVLLLDGLNEMPHRDFADYRARVLTWKRFLREIVLERPGLRVIFACRSLDYGAPLSSPDQRVPQVLVEPMTDEQVQSFLHRYAPAQADAIWAGLRGTRPLELVRSPYLLSLLVEQVVASGEMPVGRAALFTGFVRRALRREIERDHPLLQPGWLLDERDYRRAVSGRQWPTPWSLPDRGALVQGLTRLAYAMQAQFAAGRASQVRVPYDTAIAMIDHPAAEDILRAGEALAVLDEHHGRDEVLFFHQLQQEYFAARHLATDAQAVADCVRRELRADAVSPPLAEVVAGLEATEPLPPLPSTGWEEIVLLAATMSDRPSAVVGTIADADPPLAARAAAQPDLMDRMPESLLAGLRARLIELGGDAAIDLRARIDAGLALGELGDPRFEHRTGPEGDAFLGPPMVEVPAGGYVIGDDTDASAGATPRHTVNLAAFEIGRFPVTNAEWSLFMAAGGYEDDRWWDTEDAKAWRRGELTAQGSRRWVREWLTKMRDDPTLLDRFAMEGMTTEQVSMWQRRLAMDEAELREYLAWKYPNRKYSMPYIGEHALHSAPSQPVSGICWYEARAYCRWLSAQSGHDYRLPSEVEWEAAARGGDDRPYPWGSDFEVAACNTRESGLRRTAPIGVMPDGRARCGAEMMAGDVEEWTGSLWGDEAETANFGYPYDPEDGREQADAAPTIRRVQRGGNFTDSAELARISVRSSGPPDTRFHGSGMRLARRIGGPAPLDGD